jgi:hypothetical protein
VAHLEDDDPSFPGHSSAEMLPYLMHGLFKVLVLRPDNRKDIRKVERQAGS